MYACAVATNAAAIFQLLTLPFSRPRLLHRPYRPRSFDRQVRRRYHRRHRCMSAPPHRPRYLSATVAVCQRHPRYLSGTLEMLKDQLKCQRSSCNEILEVISHEMEDSSAGLVMAAEDDNRSLAERLRDVYKL